jgi:hypothetical protein
MLAAVAGAFVLAILVTVWASYETHERIGHWPWERYLPREIVTVLPSLPPMSAAGSVVARASVILSGAAFLSGDSAMSALPALIERKWWRRPRRWRK